MVWLWAEPVPGALLVWVASRRGERPLHLGTTILSLGLGTPSMNVGFMCPGDSPTACVSVAIFGWGPLGTLKWTAKWAKHTGVAHRLLSCGTDLSAPWDDHPRSQPSNHITISVSHTSVAGVCNCRTFQ